MLGTGPAQGIGGDVASELLLDLLGEQWEDQVAWWNQSALQHELRELGDQLGSVLNLAAIQVDVVAHREKVCPHHKWVSAKKKSISTDTCILNSGTNSDVTST